MDAVFESTVHRLTEQISSRVSSRRRSEQRVTFSRCPASVSRPLALGSPGTLVRIQVPAGLQEGIGTHRCPGQT